MTDEVENNVMGWLLTGKPVPVLILGLLGVLVEIPLARAQEAPPVSPKTVALAEIDAGANIIFTMLNAGRAGAIVACRERGAYQIGNVRDWYPDAPDVFIASAIANVSMASVLATEDYIHDTLASDIRQVGLEVPEAVA